MRVRQAAPLASPPPYAPHYATCTDWCTQGGQCDNALRTVRQGSASREAFCIYDEWRGIDTQLVEDGLKTYKHTDANSCPDGTDIWVPRTHGMLQAVTDHYGSAARELVGIYGREDGCGSGCHFWPCISSFSAGCGFGIQQQAPQPFARYPTPLGTP